jgi:hypothetical protein
MDREARVGAADLLKDHVAQTRDVAGVVDVERGRQNTDRRLASELDVDRPAAARVEFVGRDHGRVVGTAQGADQLDVLARRADRVAVPRQIRRNVVVLPGRFDRIR